MKSVLKETMPLPFKRELYYSSIDLMEGNDVYIAQHFLLRSKYVTKFKASKVYDLSTKNAVEEFQSGNSLCVNGILDSLTASLLIKLHLKDGYKDDEKFPEGYLFKILISVYSDRTIPTTAYLIGPNNTNLFKFDALTQGKGPKGGYNSFTTYGNTPTGMYEIDLNSVAKNTLDFGSYPMVRLVKGLRGNAAISTPDTSKKDNIRSGLLIHCGEKDHWKKGVIPPSLGCIHSWGRAVKRVSEILTNDLGVKINKNLYGSIVPYPFKPQGILSLQLIEN
ncbi:hypothetical protein M0812_08090 [Anaeramoeba flamelloides]|uniref:Peptidoglycan binding-like domain-containing protein n=1 Tax=Anaeramoeba flamelloides TaxID=1746091 RepID=A0AAV8A1Z3_9EUKA|nr:hypothetical protein M0812_08090 [Anaeramoeba flamelloides]